MIANLRNALRHNSSLCHLQPCRSATATAQTSSTILHQSKSLQDAFSTACISNTSILSSITATNTTNRYYGVYAWGQSKNGTLPLPTVVDEEVLLIESQTPTEGDKAAAQPASKGLVLSSGSDRVQVFDTPAEMDVGKAFGAEKEIAQYICSPLSSSSAVIFNDGSCAVWGDNSNGKLGLPNQTDTKFVTTPTKFQVPTVMEDEVNSIKGNNDDNMATKEIGFRTIRLGSRFSAAVTTAGDLFTYGFGGSVLDGMGMLGHGDGESYTTPKRVESLIEDGCAVDDVAVSDLHMTVLTTEGEVLTTGSGSYGRLGNLESADQLFLEPVELLGGLNTLQVVGGHAFSLVLTDDGMIHGWGRNDKGQLGTGGGMMVDMYAMNELPTPIEGYLENNKVVKIAAGHSHAAAITESGELYTWGSNQHLEPQLMTQLLHTKCVDVKCGMDYTVVLDHFGQLYSFGQGKKTGVLGQASTKSVSVATLVEGMTHKSAVSISAGMSHFACLVE